MPDNVDNTMLMERLKAFHLDTSKNFERVHSRLSFIEAKLENVDSINKMQTIVHGDVTSLASKLDELERRTSFSEAQLPEVVNKVSHHEAEFESIVKLADRLESVEDVLRED